MILPFVGYFYQPILTSVNQINMKIELRLEHMRTLSGFELYADGAGSSGGVHSRHDIVGFDYHSWGGFGGIEFANRWGGCGVMVDYANIQEKPFHKVHRIEMDYLHGSAYGTFFPTEALSLNAIVGGGKTNRNPNITAYDAYLGAEYAINPCVSPILWTPLFALQYIRLNIDKFIEPNRRHIESLRTVLGLKAAYPFMIEGVLFTPEINWAWQREFLHRRHIVSIDHLLVRGPSHSIYFAGFNLLVDLCNGLGGEIAYEFEGSHSIYNHYFYAGAHIAF